MPIEAARFICEPLFVTDSSQHTSRTGNDPHSRLLVERVAKARIEDLDAATLECARYFLADTLAVGIAGKCNPAAEGVYAAMRDAAPAGEVACLGRNDSKLPAHQAAVVNGFQMHCLEWDGLHEPSVVIALCASVAALSCEIQQGEYTVGEVLLAFTVGVETAVLFGSAAATAPRFFRPSAAGVMGAAMAVGKLRGFSQVQLLDQLGLAYSQAGGTMQAHWEGSEALALQVGFAARSALTAADLVGQDVTGPHDVISGKFGYFALFETPENLDDVLAVWGAPWKMTEVAHKPFPAGRATQAALTAILELRAERDFGADEVEQLVAEVPSLIELLVSRPYVADMSPAYARLCLQYVVARMLLDWTVDPTKFTDEYFGNPDVAGLAARIICRRDANPDPNTLGPQTITVRLKDGTDIKRFVDVPLGAPGHPLTREQRIDKIARCFAAGQWSTDPTAFMTTCETLLLDAPADAILDALNGDT